MRQMNEEAIERRQIKLELSKHNNRQNLNSKKAKFEQSIKAKFKQSI